MTPDAINGLFEFVGSLMLCLNIRRMYKDKGVKGVSVLPVMFFTSWGLWNLYFYPHMGAWWSFAGAICVVLANAIWIAQWVYYTRRSKACR